MSSILNSTAGSDGGPAGGAVERAAERSDEGEVDGALDQAEQVVVRDEAFEREVVVPPCLKPRRLRQGINGAEAEPRGASLDSRLAESCYPSMMTG